MSSHIAEIPAEIATRLDDAGVAPAQRTGLVPVRISRTIVDEYCGRAVFGGDGEYPLVPASAGVHLLPRATAQAMLDDAIFNGDAASGPEEMPAGTRRAYRALARQLCALLDHASTSSNQTGIQ